jgi:hypothetical protein
MIKACFPSLLPLFPSSPPPLSCTMETLHLHAPSTFNLGYRHPFLKLDTLTALLLDPSLTLNPETFEPPEHYKIAYPRPHHAATGSADARCAPKQIDPKSCPKSIALGWAQRLKHSADVTCCWCVNLHARRRVLVATGIQVCGPHSRLAAERECCFLVDLLIGRLVDGKFVPTRLSHAQG